MANFLVGKSALKAAINRFCEYLVGAMSDQITESHNNVVKYINETSGSLISRGEKKVTDKLNDLTQPGTYKVKTKAWAFNNVSSEMVIVSDAILRVSSPAEGYILHEIFPFSSLHYTNDEYKKSLLIPLWRIKRNDDWGLWRDYAGNAYDLTTLNDTDTELPGPIERNAENKTTEIDNQES